MKIPGGKTPLLTRLAVLAVILAGGYQVLFQSGSPPTFAPTSGMSSSVVSPESQGSGQDEAIEEAFRNRLSDLQVTLEGQVEKVLPDDLKGSRHQRFIVRLDSGRTLLVAHNIDLAPRVDGLAEGDRVELFGEYEWNERGGVIHWTHHDPRGSHEDGWIRHRGRRYQ